jgi:hypothetical protein
VDFVRTQGEVQPLGVPICSFQSCQGVSKRCQLVHASFGRGGRRRQKRGRHGDCEVDWRSASMIRTNREHVKTVFLGCSSGNPALLARPGPPAPALTQRDQGKTRTQGTPAAWDARRASGMRVPRPPFVVLRAPCAPIATAVRQEHPEALNAADRGRRPTARDCTLRYPTGRVLCRARSLPTIQRCQIVELCSRRL